MLYETFKGIMDYHRHVQTETNVNSVPVFLSAPGVGKTAFHNKYAIENGMEMFELVGSTLSPTDVVAFMPDTGNLVPFFNAQIPWADLVGEKHAILFLDELANTHPEVQKSLQKLIHERQLMGRSLGKNVVISAASNRMKDKSGVNALSMAVNNRLTFYVWGWNKESNDAYANYIAENFDVPMLPAFLLFSPLTEEHFNQALTTKQEDYTAWPTPRSVERVAARHMWCINNKRRLEQWMIEGDVGKGWACEYLSFLSLADKLPDVEKIVANPESVKIPEKLNEQFALTALIIRANSKENIKSFNTFIKRMDLGMRVLYMLYATKNPELVNTKEFNELLGDKEVHRAVGIRK